MPDEPRYESADLEDYEVQDASDTLEGDPGDDPLDSGVIAPQHWSAGMKFGSTAAEQEEGESLDQLLAEEEPDITDEVDDIVRLKAEMFAAKGEGPKAEQLMTIQVNRLTIRSSEMLCNEFRAEGVPPMAVSELLRRKLLEA